MADAELGVQPAAAPPARWIALIGMPGCGKSTVGRQLARLLEWPWVDSDSELTRSIGPIRAYFEAHGEAAFRDAEHAALQAILTDGRPAGVLSTGGGIVLRPENRALLQQHAQVFYLRTPVEDLVRRLRHDTTRPLLQKGDPAATLRTLFRERDPLYRATAQHTVEVHRPSVSALVNHIRMQVELGH